MSGQLECCIVMRSTGCGTRLSVDSVPLRSTIWLLTERSSAPCTSRGTPRARSAISPQQDVPRCRYATIIVFFAGTMSVLTLLVQGTTMPAMLALLGVTKKTPVQIQHLLMAAKEVEEYADRNLSHLRVRPSPPALVCATALVYAVAVRCNCCALLTLALALTAGNDRPCAALHNVSATKSV